MTLGAENIAFAYGPRTVLHQVSLAIPAGIMSCLVGPNGSGKSTLLGLLAGAKKPLTGNIRIGDKALTELAPAERAARVGWLPQGGSEFFGFTVAETVAFGLEAGRAGLALADGTDRARIDRVLADLAIDELAHRPLHALSGGERQRALLAGVLAPDPELLLLDEPTAGLDPHHAVLVFQHLAGLAGRGRAVLAVTHDLNLASLFADRLLLLAAGRIEAQGSPAEVLREELLRRVYGAGIVIANHPAADRPMALPARQDEEAP